MLYPSIDSLLEKVPSKYLLVTLASKRARQIQENRDYLVNHYVSHKNVGKSLEEINAGMLTIGTFQDEEQDQ